MADSAHLDRLYRGFQPFEDWVASSVDLSLWDEARARLIDARKEASGETFDALLQEVLRQAAIDTGAIEQLYTTDRGFTVTVAGMATKWEAEIAAQKGHDVARMVVGHKHAYDLALDVVTMSTPLSEALIRQMHAEACSGQDTYEVRTPAGPQRHPLPKGEYKRHANHVETADGTMHAYAPVGDVPEEMHRLVSVLQSDRFEQAHPVVQAAWAHHALVVVHPFADGNGRVARVLASIYLLRAASIPLVVFADQRPGYLDALASTDDGRPEKFVSLLMDRSVDTLLFLVEALRARAALPTGRLLQQRLEERGQRLTEREQSLTRRWTAVTRLQDTTKRLLGAIGMEARQVVPAQIKVALTFLVAAPPDGYTRPDHEVETLNLTVSAGGEEVTDCFTVLVSNDTSDRFELRLWSLASGEVLPVRISDLVPAVSTQTQLRIHEWLRRLVNELIGRLAEKL